MCSNVNLVLNHEAKVDMVGPAIYNRGPPTIETLVESSILPLIHVRLIRLAYQALFSHNKPATSNQPTVLFSQTKSAPAISH
jgi:hypothetical protein